MEITINEAYALALQEIGRLTVENAVLRSQSAPSPEQSAPSHEGEQE